MSCILFIGSPGSGKSLRASLTQQRLPAAGTATATVMEAIAFAANNPAPDLVVVMQYTSDDGALRAACAAAWPRSRILTLSWIDARKLRTDMSKITAQVDKIVAAYEKVTARSERT